MVRAGWTLLVVALLSILAVMSYLISQVYNEAPPIDNPSSESQIATAEELAADPELEAEIEEALEAKMLATLLSVTDSEDYGVATREYVDGVFTYEVILSIEDPPLGFFYEGWLAGGRVISTGALEKEEENTYTSTFTSEEDLTNLTDVIITQETSADGLDNKPELHLLEGQF